MTRRKHVLAICLCPFLLTALAPAALADMVEFELSFEFSGAQQPSGSPIATFDTAGAGAGNVLLTLDVMGLSGSEKIKDWMFNFNPSLDPTDLVFTHQSGSTTSSGDASTGVNAFMADGDGKYDILFEFSPDGGFPQGTTSVWEISFTSDLMAADFNFLSFPAGGHGPFLTAAHVLGIGQDGQGSGWVTVPAPGAAMLGLLGLGLVGSLRRRVA